MNETGRPFTAGIIDFNLKRMTREEVRENGIPDNLTEFLGDQRQYALNIASHFPDGVSYFHPDRPWFFRRTLSDPEQIRKLGESDVLILSGSGMSAYRFAEKQYENFTPEDISRLENAEKIVRNQLGDGKFVLGICFGGQLGMHAIEGKIGRLPDNVTEAGWLEHTLTPEGRQDEVFGHLPENFFAPHFHNDYVAELPAVGTVIHTDSGDITVTSVRKLAVRNGYLDKTGLKNEDTEYIMASVVEFDNGARYYQIQPHPEMATPTKADFLVRKNGWLSDEKEMGADYYRKAQTIPKDADFSVARGIPNFIAAAKTHLENLRGVRFIQAEIIRHLYDYLIR
jgi:GMP synthase-like glutamine amidotransferase